MHPFAFRPNRNAAIMARNQIRDPHTQQHNAIVTESQWFLEIVYLRITQLYIWSQNMEKTSWASDKAQRKEIGQFINLACKLFAFISF